MIPSSQPSDYQLPAISLPYLVQLGLTYRCNLRCEHCYALYRRDLREFSKAEIYELATQLWDLGSCSIVYSHGENLIRQDFHEIAKWIHAKGFYQTLMSNGFFLRTRHAAQKLTATGVDRVLISLDSIDPYTHDKKRGAKGAFEIALKAVDLLKTAGVPAVGFSTTLDVHNYTEIEAIVGLAKDRGLDAVSFMQNRYNRPGIFSRELWLSYVQVCRTLYELMLLNRGIIDIYTHDPFMLTLLDKRLDTDLERANFIGSNLCNVGTSMISIDPVGNVTGCNFIEDIIGNVRSESVADIWKRLVARYSDVTEPPTGPCDSCSKCVSCMGGCKAFHYIGKYDERCGETRFSEDAPHGLPTHQLPMIPVAPLTKLAGQYEGKLTVIS